MPDRPRMSAIIEAAAKGAVEGLSIAAALFFVVICFLCGARLAIAGRLLPSKDERRAESEGEE